MRAILCPKCNLLLTIPEAGSRVSESACPRCQAWAPVDGEGGRPARKSILFCIDAAGLAIVMVYAVSSLLRSNDSAPEQSPVREPAVAARAVADLASDNDEPTTSDEPVTIKPAAPRKTPAPAIETTGTAEPQPAPPVANVEAPKPAPEPHRLEVRKAGPDDPLRYAWIEGEKYGYSFEIKTDSRAFQLEIRGTINYSVTKKEGDAAATPKPDEPQLYVLKYQATSNTRSSSDRSMFRSPFSNVPSQDKGQLVLDASGHIMSTESAEEMPSFFGSTGSFTIEQLPPAGQTKWERTSNVSILRFDAVRAEQPNLTPRFRRPPTLDRNGRYGRVAPSKNKLITQPAVESVRYELTGELADVRTIKKHYSLKTTSQAPEATQLELTTDAVIQFDVKAGVPQSMTSNGILSISKDEITIRVPIRTSYTRYDVHKAMAEAEKQLAKFRAEQARAATPEGRAEKFKELLANVRDPQADFPKRYTALSELSRMTPIPDRRAEVLKAVEPLITSSDSPIRRTAIEVLGTWGTEENLPTLVKLLDGSDAAVRLTVFRALGHTKQERAAEAIVAHIKTSTDFAVASSGLEEIGIAGETPVLKLLGHDDPMVRYQAARTLGQIGGARSYKALKDRLPAEKEAFPRMGIEGALRRIETQKRTTLIPPNPAPPKSSSSESSAPASK